MKINNLVRQVKKALEIVLKSKEVQLLCLQKKIVIKFKINRI